LGDAVDHVHALDDLAINAVVEAIGGFPLASRSGWSPTLMKNCPVALSMASACRAVATAPCRFNSPFAVSFAMLYLAFFSARSGRNPPPTMQ
jgi:hypothetical protein